MSGGVTDGGRRPRTKAAGSAGLPEAAAALAASTSAATLIIVPPKDGMIGTSGARPDDFFTSPEEPESRAEDMSGMGESSR